MIRSGNKIKKTENIWRTTEAFLFFPWKQNGGKLDEKSAKAKTKVARMKDSQDCGEHYHFF